MKVKTKIPAWRFSCGESPVKAEGKAAVTPWCYRVRLTGKKKPVAVIELHSRITGRKMGYFGNNPDKPLVASRSGARVWERKDFVVDKVSHIPGALESRVSDFIKVAQGAASIKALPRYKAYADQAWKLLDREARKR